MKNENWIEVEWHWYDMMKKAWNAKTQSGRRVYARRAAGIAFLIIKYAPVGERMVLKADRYCLREWYGRGRS